MLEMILALKNMTDGTEYEIQADETKRSFTGYFEVEISLASGMPDGEYSYELMDSKKEKTYSKGLMRIGNYEINEEESKTYEQSGNTGYIQYQG